MPEIGPVIKGRDGKASPFRDMTGPAFQTHHTAPPQTRFQTVNQGAQLCDLFTRGQVV